MVNFMWCIFDHNKKVFILSHPINGVFIGQQIFNKEIRLFCKLQPILEL